MKPWVRIDGKEEYVCINTDMGRMVEYGTLVGTEEDFKEWMEIWGLK